VALYKGEFLNDKPEGRGKIIFVNGIELLGNFQNGKLIGYSELYNTI